MANIKKIFGGTSKSGTDHVDLKVHANYNNELFISIQDVGHDYPIRFICLDYDTAVSFVDEVRKCIGQINRDSE